MALPHEIGVDWYAIEEPWTLQHNHYDATPVGDPIDKAHKAMRLLTEITQTQ